MTSSSSLSLEMLAKKKPIRFEDFLKYWKGDILNTGDILRSRSAHLISALRSCGGNAKPELIVNRAAPIQGAKFQFFRSTSLLNIHTERTESDAEYSFLISPNAVASHVAAPKSKWTGTVKITEESTADVPSSSPSSQCPPSPSNTPSSTFQISASGPETAILREAEQLFEEVDSLDFEFELLPEPDNI